MLTRREFAGGVVSVPLAAVAPKALAGKPLTYEEYARRVELICAHNPPWLGCTPTEWRNLITSAEKILTEELTSRVAQAHRRRYAGEHGSHIVPH